jgi:cytochrome b561
LIALLVIAMIPMGKSMAGLDPRPDKVFLLRLHAAVGVTVLLLSLIRLVLHLKGPLPAYEPDWPGWMGFASKFMHWALMTVLLLVLASGLTSFAGYGFLELAHAGQWTPWPDTEAIPPLGGHRLMINLLIALAALHAAALYHQFLRPDRLFARMWFRSGEDGEK